MRLCLYNEPYQSPSAADTTSEGTCSAEDYDLLTGLESWWPLTNGANGLLDTDYGPNGNDLSHTGAPPTFIADTDRGSYIGAANFGAAVFFVFTDASGEYSGGEFQTVFTWGVWVKLDDLLHDGTILYYGDLLTQYELRYETAINRFVWEVEGNSGQARVIGNSSGAVVAGEWYWIEASYSSGTATLRVALDRTDQGFPLSTSADSETVPGNIKEVLGNVVIGFGTDVLHGRIGPVGFWSRELNSCERGRINQPTDYPFEVTASEDARLTEEGDERIDEDGEGRITE